jgi:hypothetical protein
LNFGCHKHSKSKQSTGYHFVTKTVYSFKFLFWQAAGLRLIQVSDKVSFAFLYEPGEFEFREKVSNDQRCLGARRRTDNWQIPADPTPIAFELSGRWFPCCGILIQTKILPPELWQIICGKNFDTIVLPQLTRFGNQLTSQVSSTYPVSG